MSKFYPLQPPHILLADDDNDDCLLFEDALNELSLSTHLTTVRNGEHLMQLLNTIGQVPDVLSAAKRRIRAYARILL